MTEEIKEILNGLSKKASIYKMQINEGTSFNTDEYEANELLNYITNLQKENQELQITVNDCKQEKENFRKLKERYQLEKEIYKSRNEKVVEYLLNNKLYMFKYDDEELFEITTDKKAKDDLLNILQGDDYE